MAGREDVSPGTTTSHPVSSSAQDSLHASSDLERAAALTLPSPNSTPVSKKTSSAGDYGEDAVLSVQRSPSLHSNSSSTRARAKSKDLNLISPKAALQIKHRPPKAADFEKWQDDDSQAVMQTLHQPPLGIRTVYYKHQIQSYSIADATKFGSLFTIRGTILWDRFIWLQIVVLVGIAAIAGLLTWALLALGLKLDFNVVYNFYTPFSKLLNYILSLYVSLGLTRWWSIRSFLTTFWSSFLTFATLVGTYAPSITEANVKLRKRVLRYGLLSHALLYKASQHTDEDFSDLLQRGLILPEEIPQLAGREAKAQVVITWVGEQLELHGAAGKFIPGVATPYLHAQLINVQNSIVNSVAFRITQLPYPYVHLITFMTKVTLILMASSFGSALCVVWYTQGVRFDVATVSKIPTVGTLLLTSSILLVVNSLFYQGLLDLQKYIEDPFGNDVIDFPEYGFHSRLKKEAEATMDGCKSYQELLSEPASPMEPENDPEVITVLKTLGQLEYAPLFAKQKVQYNSLAGMDGMLIHSMGVPIGPAFIMAKAFKELPRGSDDGPKKSELVKL